MSRINFELYRHYSPTNGDYLNVSQMYKREMLDPKYETSRGVSHIENLTALFPIRSRQAALILLGQAQILDKDLP